VQVGSRRVVVDGEEKVSALRCARAVVEENDVASLADHAHTHAVRLQSFFDFRGKAKIEFELRGTVVGDDPRIGAEMADVDRDQRGR
jgi:hypothetical protein